MAQSYSTRPAEAVDAAELVQGRDGQAMVVGVDVSKADLGWYRAGPTGRSFGRSACGSRARSGWASSCCGNWARAGA